MMQNAVPLGWKTKELLKTFLKTFYCRREKKEEDLSGKRDELSGKCEFFDKKIEKNV